MAYRFYALIGLIYIAVYHKNVVETLFRIYASLDVTYGVT